MVTAIILIGSGKNLNHLPPLASPHSYSFRLIRRDRRGASRRRPNPLVYQRLRFPPRRERTDVQQLQLCRTRRREYCSKAYVLHRLQLGQDCLGHRWEGRTDPYERSVSFLSRSEICIDIFIEQAGERYPSHCLRIQCGIWDASEHEGTSEWARGPIDWSQQPEKIPAYIHSMTLEC